MEIRNSSALVTGGASGLGRACAEALAARDAYDPREFAATVLHILDNGMLNGETVRRDGAIRMAPR